ncbi:hypothetical protein [Anaeromyxobacter oryzisoli]|uniref:hypothetical protein n=1 Tax=Anaeromyxobacter oryzisoli TaxID=2925408 RepID=UPI001F577AE3|nr:hypothetical protein [Anaeromyxobacter sp. SG63]
MVDYRTHVAALEAFRAALAAQTISDPKLASTRDRAMQDLASAPDVALLGALVDHLVWHAASDGTELALLERSASLWRQGATLYAALGQVRADLEESLASPADPSSVAKFSAASANMKAFADGMTLGQGELGALRADIEALTHLPPHPRQQDRKLHDWTWADVFLARRTDALARALHARASDPPTRAFALGALSSYGANACGSAYLGQVVGGPRRCHRHRDRLARNTMGSWLAQSRPTLRSLSDLANAMRPGGGATPALPAAVEQLVTEALTSTYDLSRTPPLPDLQLGYRRLIRHLELLDGFAMPPAPVPPMEPFLTALYGDPTRPAPSLVPAPAGAGGGPGAGGVKPQWTSSGKPAKTDSPPSTGDRCGSFWELILLAVVFLAGGFIYCIGKWGQKERCEIWDNMVNDWNTAFAAGGGAGQGALVGSSQQQLTAGELAAAAQVDQVTALVGYLFDLQRRVWEGLDQAYTFLAVYGIIYPDGLLARPLYQEFTAIPPPGSWPHVPVPDPEPTVHLFPATPIEQPAAAASPLPAGATPDAVLLGVAGAPLETASDTALRVWDQLARGVLDANNLDLDADRGWHHACWSTGGSIDDVPLAVDVLPYAAT